MLPRKKIRKSFSIDFLCIISPRYLFSQQETYCRIRVTWKLGTCQIRKNIVITWERQKNVLRGKILRGLFGQWVVRTLIDHFLESNNVMAQHGEIYGIRHSASANVKVIGKIPPPKKNSCVRAKNIEQNRLDYEFF